MKRVIKRANRMMKKRKEEIKVIRDLRDKGFSLREIGDLVGRSHEGVRYILKKGERT